MPVINFWKIAAAGNDFVLIDHRRLQFKKREAALSRQLCDRHFGIGADGIILIEDGPDCDFVMQYYNTDGSGPAMCGNGGRAALFFVHGSGISRKRQYFFRAADGPHAGLVEKGQASLTIRTPQKIEKMSLAAGTAWSVDTGVPHLIIFRRRLQARDLTNTAPRLRRLYDTNVNFIWRDAAEEWHIRTFERGVEGVTLACGTGATAAAIAINRRIGQPFPITMHAEGGGLTISERDQQLWLSGPVKKIFEGQLEINL